MSLPPFPQPPADRPAPEAPEAAQAPPSAAAWPTPVGHTDPALGPYAVPVPAPDDTRRRAGTALGWAIGAAVAAGLAVVLAGAALVVALGDGLAAGLGSDPMDGGYEPLRGQVAALPDGSRLSSDRLERTLDDLERDNGWVVDGIDCPDTASVTRSTVVVCTGTYEGDPWTGVVLFEDSVGSFLLDEY